LPYRLRRDEEIELSSAIHELHVGNSAVILVLRAIRLALADIRGAGELSFNSVTAEQWAVIRRKATLHGILLSRLGFWNVLQHYLSHEAVNLVRDGFGYESIVCNWNAAEAIRWFVDDFAKSDYLTVKGGMQEVAAQLWARFRNASKGNRWFPGHHLTSVSKEGKSYRLTFTMSEESGRESSVQVLANRVVLALPKQDLLQVEFHGFDDRKDKDDLRDWRGHLDDVAAQTLFKLFLAYDEPWWLGGRKRFVTDLPLRQVYCFAPDRSSNQAWVMASYNDGHYADFWSPVLLDKSGDAPYLREGFLSLSDGEPLHSILKRFGISERLMSKAHKQLELLHGDTIPEPRTGLAVAWRRPDHLDGWHTWNVPCQTQDSIVRIRRVFSKQDIFVCGEAYSAEQGWIEGALRSAEGVLSAMGEAPPAWVSEEDFWERQYSGYYEYVDAPMKRTSSKKTGDS